MMHQMNLHDAPFDNIACGVKTIELRLWDEKRRRIKVGDEILFTHSKDSARTLHCRVIALHIFPSFKELYKNLSLLKCGYTERDIDIADPSDMDLYYTKEQQSSNGVVGIEFELM
ncbi:MAG: ASCH domain-containing protein [Clostridia bacterium]|nr:ASCH domain-containing protein [Clostridia bacterium]